MALWVENDSKPKNLSDHSDENKFFYIYFND